MTPYSLIFSMCNFRIKRLFLAYVVNHINIIHCFFLFLNFVAFFHSIEIFFELFILITLWLLRREEGEGRTLEPSRYVFAIMSHLLKFSRQWHLCKFLILGHISTHLFGLVFPSLTSRKMSLGSTAPSHSPPLPPLLLLRWNFLKLCF